MLQNNHFRYKTISNSWACWSQLKAKVYPIYNFTIFCALRDLRPWTLLIVLWWDFIILIKLLLETTWEVGISTIPVLQMRKQRELRQLPQSLSVTNGRVGIRTELRQSDAWVLALTSCVLLPWEMLEGIIFTRNSILSFYYKQQGPKPFHE